MFEFDGKPGVTFVGSYLPRACGIATFTHDLAEAVARGAGSFQSVIVCAMNDRPGGYAYDSRVKLAVREDRKSDYRLAANCINSTETGVVCLQHEFGIYGGKWGDYVLEFFNSIRRPTVVTCHTVPAEPDSYQRDVLAEIVTRADAVVVMHPDAPATMESSYRVSRSKVTVIPHGIHDIPFSSTVDKTRLFGPTTDGPVMLTFGLLHRNKGIEYMIDAMPSVVRNHASAKYVVLGATHPHVLREEGNSYREHLARRARALGVERNVVFVDKFVDLPELLKYLSAADIFVAPYLEMNQVTSGALAYAVGAGKAIVATPFDHARELLAHGRGVLVEPRDSSALAAELVELLDNKTRAAALRRAAYAYGRKMVWSTVAGSYLDVFDMVAMKAVRPSRVGMQHGWVRGSKQTPNHVLRRPH